MRVHSQWFLEGPHANWNNSTIVQNFLSPALVFGAVLSSWGSSFRKQKSEKSPHTTCLVHAPAPSTDAWRCWLWVHLQGCSVRPQASGHVSVGWLICGFHPFSPWWWHRGHAALGVFLQGFYTEDFLPPPLTPLHLQTLLCACVCSKHKVGYHTHSHRTCPSHVAETTRCREVLVHPQLFPWDMFLEVGSTYQRSCACSRFLVFTNNVLHSLYK